MSLICPNIRNKNTLTTRVYVMYRYTIFHIHNMSNTHTHTHTHTHTPVFWYRPSTIIKRRFSSFGGLLRSASATISKILCTKSTCTHTRMRIQSTHTRINVAYLLRSACATISKIVFLRHTHAGDLIHRVYDHLASPRHRGCVAMNTMRVGITIPTGWPPCLFGSAARTSSFHDERVGGRRRGGVDIYAYI